MERVVNEGQSDFPTLYFNVVDWGLVSHYCDEMPEDVPLRIVVTDDMPEGRVALDSVGDMPEESLAAFSTYWESGIDYARTQMAVEVAYAKRGLPDDTPAMVLFGENGEVTLVTLDELKAAADAQRDEDAA